jgi:ribosomal protein L37AE/L43A
VTRDELACFVAAWKCARCGVDVTGGCFHDCEADERHMSRAEQAALAALYDADSGDA